MRTHTLATSGPHPEGSGTDGSRRAGRIRPNASRSSDARHSGDLRSTTSAAVGGSRALTGLPTLLAFMVRRDRIRGAIWIYAMAVMTAYFANAIGYIMDKSMLESMQILSQTPVMGLVAGRDWGGTPTVSTFIATKYGVFLMIGAALMSITTITRHTRAEEQTGRAELVRSNATGRHTQLGAALILAFGMNVVTSVLMVLAFWFSLAKPESLTGVVLFCASVGAVGFVFAAIAAMTVQFSGYSRAGSGIAGAILAICFVIRGLGDMSSLQTGDLAWLSWLSPLGWSQLTAPFALDRWWPLWLSLGLTAVLIPIAVWLQSKRDLAAGLFPDRLGRNRARPGLRSPFALALRLQQSSLLWWTLGMLGMGLIFGAFTGAMRDGAKSMPPQITELMGGSGGMVNGYLGFMALYFVIIVAVYGLLAASSLRAEEQAVRTEPVLTTAVGRGTWLCSWTAVVLLGSLWLLAVAGLGEGIGAAGSANDWSLLWPTILGHAAQTASVWVLVGLTMALYGIAPRLTGLGWVIFAYSAFLALFGQMLQFDESVLDTSLFTHIGQYPAQDLSPVAVLVLLGLTAALVGLGTVGFRRRDLTTA